MPYISFISSLIPFVSNITKRHLSICHCFWRAWAFPYIFSWGMPFSNFFMLVRLKSVVMVKLRKEPLSPSLGGITIRDCADRITDYADRWTPLNPLPESVAAESRSCFCWASWVLPPGRKCRCYRHSFDHPLPDYQNRQERAFYLLLLESSLTINKRDKLAYYERIIYLEYFNLIHINETNYSFPVIWHTAKIF